MSDESKEPEDELLDAQAAVQLMIATNGVVHTDELRVAERIVNRSIRQAALAGAGSVTRTLPRTKARNDAYDSGKSLFGNILNPGQRDWSLATATALVENLKRKGFRVDWNAEDYLKITWDGWKDVTPL